MWRLVAGSEDIVDGAPVESADATVGTSFDGEKGKAMHSAVGPETAAMLRAAMEEAER